MTITQHASDNNQDYTCLSINELILTSFRNYSSLKLQTDDSPVILMGSNGAGKTNILEAISFLIPGRGMRKARLTDIDCKQPRMISPWAVAAKVKSHREVYQLGTGRNPESHDENAKRIVKIEGETAKSQNALAEYCSAIWLIPQMNQLFLEGGNARRKFLDRLVYSFEPTHATHVSRYEQAMRERNRLLQMGKQDPYWFAAIEQKMAENAAAITIARLNTVSHINHTIADSGHSFPKAELYLKGILDQAIENGASALEAEQIFLEQSEIARSNDAQTGRSSIGPHRSELEVIHQEKQMEAALCSTGEQKALLLSILIAHVEAGAKWHGRIPIMLLDEVIAHLDNQRKNELFNIIHALKVQAWMTGVDGADFAGMAGCAQFFRVENGSVLAENC